MKKITAALIKKIYQPRKKDSHKGSHGHALLVAGNTGKMGAAVICATACMRSGPGLLTVLVPKEERLVLQIKVPEAMLVFTFPHQNKIPVYSALGIGPGIGISTHSALLVKKALQLKIPLVLDADALNIIAANEHLKTKLPAGTILTPHVKEFDRLFGEHDNKMKRKATAIARAAQLNIIIVLKDATTLITNGRETFVNEKENPGLAKGGSGDALTGIILALCCQGYSPFYSSILGVYLHSMAAGICSAQQSAESMMVTDVIENLGAAFKTIK